ncbi:hypothetical protein [Sphingobacterium daejeonense]|uniref:hypothetical protein n=1 Tax=Sphingobacterium daejeonense TaxID=371142 RepID=UPI003D31E3B3
MEFLKLFLITFLLCVMQMCFAQNLLNLSEWTAGEGPIAGFTLNGPTAENLREWGDGPQGNRAVLWKALPSGDGNNDGGFNSTDFSVDHKKMYRYTIWLKKTNSIEGSSYFGCGNVNTLSGALNSNAYFWNGDLPELNKWYLLVGYIHGSTDASTVSLGGIYDGITGRKVLSITDYKSIPGNTTNKIRSYLFYDNNSSDRQYFYGPRVEEVNGNEPTIASLLNNANSGGDFYFAGKVGIKTDTPRDFDLAVNGKIRSQEIKVEAANWPDYVFKKDHLLPTLTETEEFINKNGHLPDVPSANEAERNGISLGEMNKILLKKIEEITLYLIDKDKEFDKLKKEMDTLNHKLRNF